MAKTTFSGPVNSVNGFQDNGTDINFGAPTQAIRGAVLGQTNTVDIGGAPSQADFNALLAKLRAAGILNAPA